MPALTQKQYQRLVESTHSYNELSALLDGFDSFTFPIHAVSHEEKLVTLAKDPNAPMELLHKLYALASGGHKNLSNSADDAIMQALAQNPNLPLGDLRELAGDTEYSAYALQNDAMPLACLSDPNFLQSIALDRETLQKAFQHPEHTWTFDDFMAKFYGSEHAQEESWRRFLPIQVEKFPLGIWNLVYRINRREDNPHRNYQDAENTFNYTMKRMRNIPGFDSLEQRIGGATLRHYIETCADGRYTEEKRVQRLRAIAENAGDWEFVDKTPAINNDFQAIEAYKRAFSGQLEALAREGKFDEKRVKIGFALFSSNYPGIPEKTSAFRQYRQQLLTYNAATAPFSVDYAVGEGSEEDVIDYIHDHFPHYTRGMGWRGASTINEFWLTLRALIGNRAHFYEMKILGELILNETQASLF